MSELTKYTLNDLLAELGVDLNNMQGFILKMNQILSSNSDSVEITQTLSDGTTQKTLVPSFGYLNNKVENLRQTFESLLNSNANVVGVKDDNGNVRKFVLQNTASLISELESINQANIPVPTDFRVKNNWFFESFLNPLLFISVNVEPYLTGDVDRFEVKRVIVDTNNDDELTSYFDTTYKQKNDIDYKNFIVDINNRGFTYVEDDNIVDLPTSINRARGSFDVMAILQQDVAELVNENVATVPTKMYQLNTLQYTYLVNNQSTTKFLVVGDILITATGTEYQISGLDKSKRTVTLVRTFGIEGIAIGANTLRIKPQPYKVPELQINLGFNEREVIFIRPISTTLDLTTDVYSNGFGIFSNELNIITADGSTSTLADYYNNFVSDFGLLFLSFAKEKKLPATLGLKPLAPVLDVNNFKVVQIDTHITDSSSVTDLKNQLSTQAKLKNQMSELDKNLDTLKAQLNTDQSLSLTQKSNLQKTLSSKILEKTTAFNQLSTISKQITLNLKTTPTFLTAGKYNVRGFWEIPAAQNTTYGTQQVVQFKVRYRYLSQDGNAANSTQITFTDASGAQKTGFFSNYTEVLTKARIKAYDSTTGVYTWVEENVSDADAVNSNQIAITIRKGEQVEIQVTSLSEAGYPDNPVTSDWSNAVTIAFPGDIQSQEESSLLSQEAFSESAKTEFQQDLNAKGLDIHLQNSFTKGDAYYGHSASDIASGFFDTNGNVINMMTYIQSLTDQINALKQAITIDKGVIQITITDGDGNTITVTNGQTVNLFAGFYKEKIQTSTGSVVSYDDGKIISAQYIVSISNTSQSPLALVSYLMGGIDEAVTKSFPAAFTEPDYNNNRRYDRAPITANNLTAGVFNGLKQINGFQSSQVKSQYVYLRYKDYGLSNKLLSGDNLDLTPPTSDTNPASYLDNPIYDYKGTVIAGSTAPGGKLPYISGKYLPFDPTSTGAGYFATNANVFKGFIEDSSNPGSYINDPDAGYLSEFCIHKSHPSLPDVATVYKPLIANPVRSIFLPTYSASEFAAGLEKTLPFSHAIHFETSVEDNVNVFGAKYYAQAEYFTPVSPTSAAIDDAMQMVENMYPIKIGFEPADEFLIGKFTCGSYLFLMPGSYSDISVDGNHPALAKKEVTFGPENSLNIPLIFQYRASDKLGYVGGYRASQTLKNIKYSKTVGLDIYTLNGTPFSFDINVSCQYQRDTVTNSPIVPNKGKTQVK